MSSSFPLWMILSPILTIFVIYVLVAFCIGPLFTKAHARDFSLPDITAQNERVLCIDDNEDALTWRLRLIDRAQEKLVFSTFDLRDDETGGTVIAALSEAASRGVRVSVLLDDANCALHLRKSDAFKALAKQETVEVRRYNPINLLKPWELNFRLHDKYLIADDSVYMLGGRNTNNLFLAWGHGRHNIDRDLVVFEANGPEGTSLSQLNVYFDHIWAQDCCKTYSPKLSEDRAQAAAQNMQDTMTALRANRTDVYVDVNWEEETFPARSVTLLTNATQNVHKEPELWCDIQRLMAKGSECVIISPYVICGHKMYKSLHDLAEGRKIDIVTNAAANGANPWGCSDYLTFKRRLLHTGVGVYETFPGQSLHTKTVLVDDYMSIVGSYNLDIRSTLLDTELMLAVDSPELNAQLRESAQELMSKGVYVTEGGEDVVGENCSPERMSIPRRIVYAGIQVITFFIRYLL